MASLNLFNLLGVSGEFLRHKPEPNRGNRRNEKKFKFSFCIFVYLSLSFKLRKAVEFQSGGRYQEGGEI